MICLNISLFIVGTFLVLTLLLGIYFSKKKTTFREYAVGNKQFATATLVATVLATAYGGGGLVRSVEQVHSTGLWWIIGSLLVPIRYWLLSALALRMGPFMKHLSMAETLGSVYGRPARVITALSGISCLIVVITGQITATSVAIGMCIDSVNPRAVTVVATLVLIFYSIFGGVRAVAFTDILQFITFAIIIPLLTWYMFSNLNKTVVDSIAFLQMHEKFQLSSIFSFNHKLLALIALCLSDTVSTIEPDKIQRIYMSSNPRQARNVFLYGSFFSLVISSFIIIIGLLVFIKAPYLQLQDIWTYVMANVSPLFKGLFSICLLAMTMSTADSCLNACSIMFSHDIVKVIRSKKEISDAYQLKIARWTILVVGLSSMFIAFHCRDLLKILYWSFDLSVPVVHAPFILAILGFRSSSRTVLIGMSNGLLSILAWNKWVEPTTGVDGAFPCMLANGLAMIAAHYLLKQPKNLGWIEPDTDFKQVQQEKARRSAERKESIKNGWANRKSTLAKLKPSHNTIVCIGIYSAITSFLAYLQFPMLNNVSWLIFQLVLSACFIGYPFFYDISKNIRAIPKWCIGLSWLIFLAFYMPRNLVWYWWHLMDPIFNTSFFLAHCTVILWVLPPYLGIAIVATTLLASIYPIITGLSFLELSALFPLFIATLLVFTITIIFKFNQSFYKTRMLYFENQEKIKESQELKASLYDAALVPSNGIASPKGYGSILKQVVRKVEESISFLDDHTNFYKQDFQSVINKFYDWVDYFNRREKAKKHALLQPNKITFDKLIRKVEIALSQEVVNRPRLLVEKIDASNGGRFDHIVCDIDQVTYLLMQAVLRVSKLAQASETVVRIQLHSTSLQFTQANPIDNSYDFPATAWIVSQATTDLIPKVKARYVDEIDFTFPKGKQEIPLSIDLQMQTISTIIGAHYGYLEASGSKIPSAMLLVLPNNVIDILGKMTEALPLDALTLETPVTPKEQADSMMALMQFHDYVCKSLCQADPIDVKTIAGLLLLLRKNFGFKRHASGQLFYVRAVGIATLVVDWVFHSPKVVYAALLYELVRHTCLPLSYIKEHYNLGVYAFVLNVLGVDKRQELEHSSLLYVKNRLEKAIKEEHVQLSVLFIKLAERLYDLRHAAGYIYLTEVQHMAQETLTIDVKLAYTYLSPDIGEALEKAAREALEIVSNKQKQKNS